jgi:hypothetical protein
MIGASITFNAVATGGVSPQYYFTWRDTSGIWHVGQAYSSTASWTWNTTGLEAGIYVVQVWAKGTGSPAAYDAYTSLGYTLTNPPVTSVTVTPAPASPQMIGASITFNAVATGGVSPQYYLTWRDTSGVWHVGQAYSSTASWTWNTTGLGAGPYVIQVWAKSAGSAAAYDAYTSLGYTPDSGKI